MRGDGSLRRKTLVMGLIVLAAGTAWPVLLPAGAPQAGSGAGAFRSGVRIAAVDLYCSGDDGRVHMDALVQYGQPKAALRTSYRSARVVMRVRVLSRRAKRVLARARDRGRIEFSRDTKRTGLWHRLRFSRRESRRIRRYARGRRRCGRVRRTRRVLVRFRLTERLRKAAEPAPRRGRQGAAPRQSGRASRVVRVGYRSCTPDPGAGCAGSPGVGEPESAPSEPGATQPPPASCPPAGQPLFPGERRVVGTVESGAIDEASGIAASRQNPGVLWLHNDSGDSARLFAISTEGSLLGIYEIAGAGAWDWEDIAIGPGPVGGADYLYVGDIGDNYALRGSVVLYRVPEPAVSTSQTPRTVRLTGAESLGLRYPDGARDAETLLVDPLDGSAYLLSKRDLRSRIYRVSGPQWAGQPRTLELMGELTWGGAVGGDVSPSGREVVVKGYSGVRLYDRPAGTALWDVLVQEGQAVPYTPEPQGEAITFCGERAGYLTVSEGDRPPLYYYDRP